MDAFIELLKIILPALIVGYLAFLIIRSFLQNKLDEILFTVRQKNQEIVMPIRLQAYERVVLLLERISPSNLVNRLNNGEYTAQEFQQILTHEIRQEFNHNLSQQVYMSSEAWTYVSSAVEQMISDINAAANTVKPDAPNLELVKALFEQQGNDKHIINQALDFIKEEIQKLF